MFTLISIVILIMFTIVFAIIVDVFFIWYNCYKNKEYHYSGCMSTLTD